MSASKAKRGWLSWKVWLAWLGGWCLPTAAYAGPLTLGQAVAAGLARSPEIIPARERLEGYRHAFSKTDTAAWPNAQLQVQGGVRGFDAPAAPEWGVNLTQGVPLGDLKGTRHAVGAAGVALGEAQLAADQLGVARAVAEAWLALRHDELDEELQHNRVSQAEELARVVLARVAVGRGDSADAALAQAALARAESEAEQAALRRAMAAQELALLIDSHDPEPPTTVGDVVGEPPPPRDLQEATVPSARAARAAAVLLDAQADATLAQGRPVAQVGASVVREGTGEWVLLGSVGIPLVWGNQNAFSAAAQRAPARALRFEAYHHLERAQKQSAYLRTRMQRLEALQNHIEAGELAATRRALAALRAQFTAGKVALPELLRAEEAVTDAQLAKLRATIRLLETRIEAAFTDGTLLSIVK